MKKGKKNVGGAPVLLARLPAFGGTCLRQGYGKAGIRRKK